MDGFSFYDYFATKDIDYLLAIISLLLLIPFWKALSGGAKESANDDAYYHNARKK
ncbi:MAG: hypothetical protein JXD19_04265 [Deltaproteobacteria bacterium]|nr:hypothetical protein [Deltaproteobacteria bacterium]